MVFGEVAGTSRGSVDQRRSGSKCSEKILLAEQETPAARGIEETQQHDARTRAHFARIHSNSHAEAFRSTTGFFRQVEAKHLVSSLEQPSGD
jgi:hypothetical protein